MFLTASSSFLWYKIILRPVASTPNNISKLFSCIFCLFLVSFLSLFLVFQTYVFFSFCSSANTTLNVLSSDCSLFPNWFDACILWASNSLTCLESFCRSLMKIWKQHFWELCLLKLGTKDPLSHSQAQYHVSLPVLHCHDFYFSDDTFKNLKC